MAFRHVLDSRIKEIARIILSLISPLLYLSLVKHCAEGVSHQDRKGNKGNSRRSEKEYVNSGPSKKSCNYSGFAYPKAMLSL